MLPRQSAGWLQSTDEIVYSVQETSWTYPALSEELDWLTPVSSCFAGTKCSIHMVSQVSTWVTQVE
jgi:hypothetical protein